MISNSFVPIGGKTNLILLFFFKSQNISLSKKCLTVTSLSIKIAIFKFFNFSLFIID